MIYHTVVGLELRMQHFLVGVGVKRIAVVGRSIAWQDSCSSSLMPSYLSHQARPRTCRESYCFRSEHKRVERHCTEKSNVSLSAAQYMTSNSSTSVIALHDHHRPLSFFALHALQAAIVGRFLSDKR